MPKLGGYFHNRKIIEIQFHEPVDLTERDIKHVVYDTLERFPVVDINIMNIPIEEVIKHLYSA